MTQEGGPNFVKPELLEPYLKSGQLTKHESELLHIGRQSLVSFDPGTPSGEIHSRVV